MQEVATPEGRRERKKRETRLALKAAALDLVSARGFNHVTVEDIANAVDVSVRTFFNYFSSKEAAIVGEGQDLIDAACRELLDLPAELSPLDALRTVLMSRVDAIGEDIDLSGEDHTVWLRRFSAVRMQPEVMIAYSKHLALVEQALTNAVVERMGGDQRLSGYASLVTTCALSAMRVAGSLWAGQGGTCPLRTVANAAFDLLGNGFSIDPTSLQGGVPSGDLIYLAGSCGPVTSSGSEVRTA